MKFGKQLQLGTFEPWKAHYIQYSKLKRIIQRRRFVADLEEENRAKNEKKLLEKRSDSFAKKAKKIKALEVTQHPDVESGTHELTPFNLATMGSKFQSYKSLAKKDDSDDDNNSDPVEEVGIDFFPVIKEEMEKISKFFVGKVAECRILLGEILSKNENAYLSHHTSGSDPTQLRKLKDIYLDLVTLKTFSELNRTGFLKIIKKYDKVMKEKTLAQYSTIIDSQPFATTEEIIQLIDTVTGLVSRDKCIEWDVFASERQNKQTTDDELFPSVRFKGLFLSLAVFAVSLLMPYLTNSAQYPANRCMSILLFVICMWITEAVPYFATALTIPILVTLLHVLKDPLNAYGTMSTEAAALFVMSNIFNHTTMLLMGGYTISSAFSRCQLELRVASIMQNRFGKSPKLFILAVMMLGLFLSMWISNHTSPILCATIILPIVRDLPSDSRFSKALLLGLAFACNFGGMMTPISSLQNVLAVSYLESAGLNVSFGRWLLVSVPFCTFCTLFAWVFLLVVVKPDDIVAIPVIVYERKKKFGKRNIAVICMSLFTILMFAFFSYLQPYFGDIGIVSLGFVVMMFGTGMLSEVDFNSLSWHTLFLVGGGNVLGKAIDSSGLLGYISDGITLALPLNSPWVSFFIVLCFSMTVATFISHTVASLILLPIILAIGQTLGMPEVVMIGAAFAVSGAMALPFSSFPNVNSLLIVDDFHRNYLSTHDFVKTGVPMSLFTLLFIATLGTLLINLIIVY